MRPKEKINFERIRFYEYKGMYLPSVTSINSVIAKGDGYERWLGNASSYRDACEYRDSRASIGLLTHDRIAKALDKKGEMPRYNTHAGFMDSFKRFCALYNPVPIYHEEQVVNLVDWYAGTFDFFGWITWRGKKTLALLDWKTKKAGGKMSGNHHLLQLGGYAKVLLATIKKRWPKTYKERIKRFISSTVVLQEDGNFNTRTGFDIMDMKETMEAGRMFSKTVSIHRWVNRDVVIPEVEIERMAFPLEKVKFILK